MHTEEIKFLAEFLTEERKARIESVLAQRTQHLTVVLENIYQPHNAAAVLRTCDCFGIQDAHIIENGNEFQPSADVSSGADKWVSVHRYNALKNNTEECLRHLKEKGYRIVATDLTENEVEVQEMIIDQPTAIVFGTEMTGISDIAREMADERVKIPMYGFTQSFNISVSAAIILSRLKEKLQASSIPWQLNPEVAEEIRLDWYRKSTKARFKP